MKPDVIVLADAGHVRDGLLYIVGGGIDQVYGSSLPVTLQMTLVMKLTLEQGDYDKEHDLALTVRNAAGEDVVARMGGTFFTKRPPAHRVPGSAFASSIKLDGLQLPEYGKYSLRLMIDEVELRDFQITVAPQTELRRRSTDKAPNPTVRPRTRKRK
jgi:hypothetical protein